MDTSHDGEEEEDALEDEDVGHMADVQAPTSGGTITIDRPAHPNPAMEQWLKDAEAGGFSVTAEDHPDHGQGYYFYLRDDCDPPHIGTVQPTEVYGIVVERIVRRCPRWRQMKKEGEEAR